MVLNPDAMMIFAIIDGFLRGAGTHKRSPMLESFPQNFDYIPWRRVYKQVAEAQSSSTAAQPTMEHWEASELSFGGAGPFWCFTELQRSGENVSRKTEDGQTWLSKSGRAPRNGFPDQIRVDKLVISGKVFHMIELTLTNQDKPTIALCKIWRKGNSEAASPQTPKPSVFSPGASTASLQVLENHFLIPEGWTEMQIDQPQGQMEGVSQQQQHMPTHELPVGSNTVPNSTRGQTEGVTQQQHMPDHALPMGRNIAVPDSIRGCVSSIEPADEDSAYQDVVLFLHETKGSFKHVAIRSKEEARWIVSTVQNAAAYLKNMFNFLGINAEAESTRPCTQLTDPAATTEANPDELAPEDEAPDQLLSCSYTHLMEAATTTEANPDEVAPEDESPDQLLSCSYTHLMEAATTTEANPDEVAPEDESPDQQPSCSLEESFFDVAMYLNLDGGNGADIDPDEAM